MSEPGWTRGEWQFTHTVSTQKDLPCVVDADRLIIAECLDDGHSLGECEANAHLISSAPMLYEACEDAVAAFRTLRNGMLDDRHALEVIDAHIDELEYAMRAARGESNA